jgi:hypothetical protein
MEVNYYELFKAYIFIKKQRKTINILIPKGTVSV